MNWHLILKSDTLWNKLSDRIVQLNEPDAYNILADILTDARRVIRGTKRLATERYVVDGAYKELSDQAFKIFSFWRVFDLYNEKFSDKMALRLLPDVIVDIDEILPVPITRVDSLYELSSTHREIAKFKNFEGYVVYKNSYGGWSAYSGESIRYEIGYYVKGFYFHLTMLDGQKYIKFLKEELRGKTILESRKTKRESFPWRRIRARGK